MLFNLEHQDAWHTLLDAYVALGGNCIDTARAYRGGESERVIGRWLKARGGRNEILILSKGAHPKSDRLPRVHPEAIHADLAESLDALQVDAIDMYALHRDDPNVPVSEIIDALDDARASGRIKTYGASNWTTARMAEAHAYAEKHGRVGFAFSSPNLSLAQPNEAPWPDCVSLTTEDLGWHETTQMPVFSWSSQARGFFTGQFRPDVPDDPLVVRVYYSDENWRRLARARRLAEEKGVDATQIALAYVLSQDFPTFALVGPKSVEELYVSTRAHDLRLSRGEVRWLDGRDGTT